MNNQSMYGHVFQMTKNKTRMCLGKNLVNPEHWASIRWNSPEKLSIWSGKTEKNFTFVCFCETKRANDLWGPHLLELCSSSADLSLTWEGNTNSVASFWSCDWGAVVFKNSEEAEEFTKHLRSSSFQFTTNGPEFFW